jgi:serine/threonine protein kinase
MPLPPWVDAADLRVGSVLDGRYRIGRELGGGFSSRVYRARDNETGDDVAVKVLRDPSAERFIREARVGTELDHPHIVKVINHGIVERTKAHYLVMELLEGSSLAEVLKRRPRWEPMDVLPLVDQLASALAAAHARGVIHRDVKAANVFQLEDGSLKLLDFGIAFEIGEVRLTAPGALVGTPSNLAPEQVQLEPMDHRVDVYALGVLVYRMIAGRMPFNHKKPQRVLMDIVRMVPRPPSELLGEGSRLVDTIVMRALEKDPDRRFASVLDFAEALRLAVESTAEVTTVQN